MINDGGGNMVANDSEGVRGSEGSKTNDYADHYDNFSDHHQDDQNYESPLHLSTFLLPIPTQEITLSQNFKREDSYSLNTNSSSSSSPPFWKIIITGISVQACDNIAYLWDMRTGGYVQYFEVRLEQSTYNMNANLLSIYVIVFVTMTNTAIGDDLAVFVFVCLCLSLTITPMGDEMAVGD